MMMAAALFLIPAGAAQSQDNMSREHLKAKQTVTESKLDYQLSFLCDSLCQGRGFATPGGYEAAFWLEEQFGRIGLLKMGHTYGRRVYIEPEKIGRNIVGMLPGSKYFTRDNYIIVGAHFDNLGELGGRMYPGADSNASGTVALLNIAEMMKTIRDLGKSHNYNIIFVAFDGKEHDMAGSKAFWKMIEYGQLKDPQTGRTITRDRISLMVNIDQIGSTLSPLTKGRDDFMIMLGEHSIPHKKRGLLEECNRRYGIGMELDLTYYGSENFTRIFYKLSDQKVFAENGIPAVMFTSGITMNTNKTRDTAASLDMKILQKRIFLIFHWIDKML